MDPWRHSKLPQEWRDEGVWSSWRQLPIALGQHLKNQKATPPTSPHSPTRIGRLGNCGRFHEVKLPSQSVDGAGTGSRPGRGGFLIPCVAAWPLPSATTGVHGSKTKRISERSTKAVGKSFLPAFATQLAHELKRSRMFQPHSF